MFPPSDALSFILPLYYPYSLSGLERQRQDISVRNLEVVDSVKPQYLYFIFILKCFKSF